MDDSTLRRKLVSVALDWNIQPGTQLQLDASHYEFIQKGYVGSFNYGPNVKLPSAPNPKDKIWRSALRATTSLPIPSALA